MSPVRTREQVLALHDQYWDDQVSLSDLAEQEALSHETIRKLFKFYGLPRRSRGQQPLEAYAEEAEQRREEIIALYKRHGTIDAVYAEVRPIPRKLISEIVATIPNRESFRRRADPLAKSREELQADMQRAAVLYGEPMTIPKYRRAQRELGLATDRTQVRFYSQEDPDTPWHTAVTSAGVKANDSRGRRANSISAEDCINAVALCLSEIGTEASYDDYTAWARGRGGVPSGPTVRNTVGWGLAKELALEKLG